MQRIVRLYLLILVLIGTSIFFSCRRKKDEARWNTDLLAPLAKTSMSIQNIVQDSMVQVNGDNSISIVDKQNFTSLTIDSLVTINTEPFLKTAKLSSLTLAPPPLTRSISLGEIAKQMIAKGGSDALVGMQIIASNGTTTFTPSVEDITAGPFDIDITSFFQTATFLSGDMTITITNGLPVNMDHVTFSINNKVSGTVITSPDFTNIAPGTSQSTTTSLAGQTVEGNITAEVTDLDLGSGIVTIDTSDKIIINIAISNIAVSSATAIWPAQNIVDETTETYLEGMGDVELTSTEILSGELVVDVVSTVDDTVYFTYKIFSATNNSVIFNQTRQVPPAPPNSNITRTFRFDFSDYILDLTGDPARSVDTVNALYSSFQGRIEYTGQVVSLSLEDSVMFWIRTENLKPDYVTGYLGRDTLNSGTAYKSIDFFKSIVDGTLNFEDVTLKLDIVNGMGVEGVINVNNVTGINTRTGQTAALNIPASTPIAKATDHPLTPVTTTIDLSSDPGTLTFLNILPDKIQYDIQVVANPAGNDNSYSDFAYRTSSFSSSLYFEIPLSIIATDLVLCDTVSFMSSQISNKNINKGTFNVIAENGFPLDANVTMYFLDKDNEVIDSLVSASTIQAAPVNGSFIVTGPRTSIIPYSVSEARMQHLYEARKIVFRVKFNTVPNTNHIKIYSDYGIKFKITGDFNYSIQ